MPSSGTSSRGADRPDASASSGATRAPRAPAGGPGDGIAGERGAPTSEPAIGIAIVSWNVSALLARCLESVRAARLGANARIVVVDNASSDGTVEMLRSAFPDVTLIANGDNRGFARGNNQALTALGVLGPELTQSAGAMTGSGTSRSRPAAGSDTLPAAGADKLAVAGAVTLPAAGADMLAAAGAGATPAAPPCVLLLNPDTEIAPDALVLLVDHLARHPGAACVAPQLRYPDGVVQSSRRRFPTLWSALAESTPVEWHYPNNRIARHLRMADAPPDAEGWVDWVNGAAMLLRTEALRAVGGFDAGFFMYSEELDLCRRLATAGWRIRYEPQAVVVHHEGKSSEQAVGARHLRFGRSRVRYFRLHHGRATAWIVRAALLALYAGELAMESVKWLVGHKRSIRRARIAAYSALLRDGLSPGPGR